MFSGRTQREKDRFAEAITDSAVKILAVDRKDVIALAVFLELPKYWVSHIPEYNVRY
jgi:phenylpyruvate tautomerase PptA (4-oxalocrotonate tautomerase family)